MDIVVYGVPHEPRPNVRSGIIQNLRKLTSAEINLLNAGREESRVTAEIRLKPAEIRPEKGWLERVVEAVFDGIGDAVDSSVGINGNLDGHPHLARVRAPAT